MSEYGDLQRSLARGWNTWNTRSMLSHVLLPDGFALTLALRDPRSGAYLKEALMRRPGPDVPDVRPGAHAYDGSYTALRLHWKDVAVEVRTATDGDEWVAHVTPLSRQRLPARLVVESGMLWNHPGQLARVEDRLEARLPGRTIAVYGVGAGTSEPHAPTQTPYLAYALSEPIGLSTGRRRNLSEITALVARRAAEQEARARRYGDLAEVHRAIQGCLAWDTIWEPEKERVVSPVARAWNVNWGGFALFCWDTYFAAYIASLDSRELAYANAVEITREATERGFVPNFATRDDIRSRDRSQPPVGSLVVRELYRRYRERWLVAEVFDALLAWNRWWPPHRGVDGLLAWGSDPYEPVADARFECESVNDLQGAAYESGLDNSPMYDGVPFDTQAHRMALADVGLSALYVADCDALADLARVLGRATEEGELRERADAYRRRLNGLWSEEHGIYLNRRTDSGEFSHRISPTLLYPLLARAATQAQAERMMADHFYRATGFWGPWMLPTIARNDPAYPEQVYWRGRVWAPTNLLVYLGLRNYDLPQARAHLAERSVALLMKEWLAHGHIHENYNADTGEGCDVASSDPYYHWGGLLGLMAFIEAGHLAPPEGPL